MLGQKTSSILRRHLRRNILLSMVYVIFHDSEPQMRVDTTLLLNSLSFVFKLILPLLHVHFFKSRYNYTENVTFDHFKPTGYKLKNCMIYISLDHEGRIPQKSMLFTCSTYLNGVLMKHFTQAIYQ